MGPEVVNEEVWLELLEECDVNKDGKVGIFHKIKKKSIYY